MTLAIKVALNPNTTNQPTNQPKFTNLTPEIPRWVIKKDKSCKNNDRHELQLFVFASLNDKQTDDKVKMMDFLKMTSKSCKHWNVIQNQTDRVFSHKPGNLLQKL